jgi:hypothetical protein
VKPFAKRLIAAGRTIGPYLAIELVMPGGSVLAVLLWLYRMSHTNIEGVTTRAMSFRRPGGYTSECSRTRTLATPRTGRAPVEEALRRGGETGVSGTAGGCPM